MKGMTHQVSFAHPVIKTSTLFMATSIDTIEIKDIPIAVLKADVSCIWRDKMKVSSAIEVTSPLIIANVIMAKVGQAIPVNWKNAMVPKSPIEHPSKHHEVFLAAVRHVSRQLQLIGQFSVTVAM